MNPDRVLIRAAMIVDGNGFCAAPGAILVEGDRIIGAGSPQVIGSPSHCRVIDLPHAVVIPALVNAHCHLDLSHIGPLPFNGSFVDWVGTVRARRATGDLAIDASVQHGIALARAGGTAIIGDIAGVRSTRPIETQRAALMPGVSYFEVFGVGQSQAKAVMHLRDAAQAISPWEDGVALGLQPHAPYSCGLDVFRAAAELRLPIATHLAETMEEIAFVRTAQGPLAEMIKGLGVWDDSIRGTNKHPIDYVAPALLGAHVVAAHLNYVDEGHLAMLASMPISVAYCPRASAYFGHPVEAHPPHQYREMMKAGINVALGTDSIICLDTTDRMSVLDDMRMLYRRDGIDPLELLRMATINGAKALGFEQALFKFESGPTAGLLAVALNDGATDDALGQALLNNNAPQWIVGPFAGKDSWRSSLG